MNTPSPRQSDKPSVRKAPPSEQGLPAILAAMALMLPATAGAHPACGIAVDREGRICYAGGTANRIVRIDPSGRHIVMAELSNPHHVASDPKGNLHVVSDRDGQVWQLDEPGKPRLIYPSPDGKSIPFLGWGGDPFAIDADGAIYCIYDRDRVFCQILRIAKDGRITLLAGGDWGHADGRGKDARFGSLHSGAFAWAPDGSLLLTDSGASVRRVTHEGEVTTVAGNEERGFADGPGKVARFDAAMGIAADVRGVIYVADAGNRRIRRIDPDGIVSTLAGSGRRGHDDGKAAEATFDEPVGVAVDPDGNIFVLDRGARHPRIRKIDPDGRVTTVTELP